MYKGRDLVRLAIEHLGSETGLTDIYNLVIAVYRDGDPELREELKTALRRLKKLIEVILEEVERYEQRGRGA